MESRGFLKCYIRALGNIFNLYGGNYDHLRRANPIYARTDLTPEQKDILNLRSDWMAVGKDLESSIKKFERENLS